MPNSQQQIDYQQVSTAISAVFELSSRIDERLKLLVTQQTETTQKIEKIFDKLEAMNTRISILEQKNFGSLIDDISELQKDTKNLELKLASLEIHQGTTENKFKTISDFVLKIILALVGAIIAWKISGK